MCNRQRGYTLVEILIVVLLLSIVAMIVVPRATNASDQARESALGVNLVGLRKAIELYKTDHRGRLPHLNEQGLDHFAGLPWRLTRRTQTDGTLDPAGSFGPYIQEWPANPYVLAAVAKQVKCAAAAAPPRDDSSGWYYSTTTGVLHVNSIRGALTLDPG